MRKEDKKDQPQPSNVSLGFDDFADYPSSRPKQRRCYSDLSDFHPMLDAAGRYDPSLNQQTPPERDSLAEEEEEEESPPLIRRNTYSCDSPSYDDLYGILEPDTAEEYSDYQAGLLTSQSIVIPQPGSQPTHREQQPIIHNRSSHAPKRRLRQPQGATNWFSRQVQQVKNYTVTNSSMIRAQVNISQVLRVLEAEYQEQEEELSQANQELNQFNTAIERIEESLYQQATSLHQRLQLAFETTTYHALTTEARGDRADGTPGYLSHKGITFRVNENTQSAIIHRQLLAQQVTQQLKPLPQLTDTLSQSNLIPITADITIRYIGNYILQRFMEDEIERLASGNPKTERSSRDTTRAIRRYFNQHFDHNNWLCWLCDSTNTQDIPDLSAFELNTSQFEHIQSLCLAFINAKVPACQLLANIDIQSLQKMRPGHGYINIRRTISQSSCKLP